MKIQAASRGRLKIQGITLLGVGIIALGGGLMLSGSGELAKDIISWLLITVGLITINSAFLFICPGGETWK